MCSCCHGCGPLCSSVPSSEVHNYHASQSLSATGCPCLECWLDSVSDPVFCYPQIALLLSSGGRWHCVWSSSPDSTLQCRYYLPPMKLDVHSQCYSPSVTLGHHFFLLQCYCEVCAKDNVNWRAEKSIWHLLFSPSCCLPLLRYGYRCLSSRLDSLCSWTGRVSHTFLHCSNSNS